MREVCPGGLHAVLRKGLRARLAWVLELLGRCDWADASQAVVALGELEILLAHLEAHRCCEDQVLRDAAIEDDGTSRAVAADHADQREACRVLAGDLARLRLAPPTTREMPALRLQHRLAVFLADYIEHMLCEDIELAALLRLHLGHEAWLRREVQSLADLPSGVRAQLMAWALPAASLREWRALERCLEAGCADGRQVFTPPPVTSHKAESPAGPGSRGGCRNVSYTPNCSW